MQKYQPCIRITSEQDNVTQSYFFSESQFIAVTAYQNSKVIQYLMTYVIIMEHTAIPIHSVLPISY